jgi:hypothetical protein
MEYRIAYALLPVGAGADDYEAADLEQRQAVVDLPAAEDGYGPSIPEVKRALQKQIDIAAEPINIRFLD